jgi:putative PIN family toxin of toxin-antitoxin system
LRVLLDTNVLVSAFLGSQLCNEVLSVVLGEHELVVSDLVVTEFETVLREKFQTSGTALKKALALVEQAEVLSDRLAGRQRAANQSNDEVILTTAPESGVDLLVTGDREVVSQAPEHGVVAVTPRGFFQLTTRTDDSYPLSSDDDPPVVSEPKHNPIKDKSFEFALEIVRLYQQLQNQQEYVLSKQLVRSGTSIGANIEEATAAESRADFIHKMKIAMKEARETHYWLRLLHESEIIENLDVSRHILEADELSRILTSITKTAIENTRALR